MLSGGCLGFCPLDLAAFLLAVALLAVIVVHRIRFNTKRKGLLAQLEEDKKVGKEGRDPTQNQV